MKKSDLRTQAYLGLAAICIIWGTTYTAIKLAVRDFPPYLLVGIRQTAAGLLLLGWVLIARQWHRDRPSDAPPLTRRYILLQGLIGLATITGGNGFITWGMQRVSSGLAAVIGSLTPVFVLVLSLLWQKSDRPNTRMVCGVLLGFAGLGVVFSEGWRDFGRADYAWGIVGCFASCFTWSLGTVLSKRFNDFRVSPLLNAGLQITAGGLGGFVLSLLFDTNWQIHHTVAGWSAVLYLILIGSAVAFSLYMFVLKQLSATVSSLYTYINPVVAITLGCLFLGERLTWWQGFGMAVTIVGVWLVNEGAGKRAATT